MVERAASPSPRSPPTGITLTATKRFAPHLPSLGSVAFAQNASGASVLVWSEHRTGSDGEPIANDRVELRVATGTWGDFATPRTLLAERGSNAAQVPSLAADINPRGHAVIASDALCTTPRRAYCVTAWTGATSQGAWGSPITTRPPNLVGPLRAAITDSGRAVLAWRTSNGDAMDPHGPVDVYAATIAPGARRFAAVQRVQRGPETYPSNSGIDLAAVPGGRATLLFSAPRNGTASEDERVLTTTTDASGRFAAPQTVVERGHAGGLAVRADGVTIVTFIDATGSGPATLQTRLRPSGASTFGPAESLGQAPRQQGDQPVTSQPRYSIALLPPPDAPVPSFDAITGRPLVAVTTAAGHSAPGHVIVLARDRP